jgi:hypothetical protein
MEDDSLGRGYRRRVLILDFDFHAAVGGGQVFYRRVVERNPSTAFYYPSTLPDVHVNASGKLLANAFPFAIDRRLDYSEPGAVAAAQGMTFDVCVEKLALGLVGWASVSVRNGYEKADEQLIANLEAAECGSVEATEVRYTISRAERTEHARRSLPVTLLDMPGVGAIVRREALRRVGGRDLAFRYVSDFDLCLRATKHGPMIHLPRKLAYWRLHGSNLTTSSKRLEMAAERIALIRKLSMDPHEAGDRELVRKTYAAAAAILGRDEAVEARKHLRPMTQLAPELIANLPPNMASYPQIWPPAEEVAGDTGVLNACG